MVLQVGEMSSRGKSGSCLLCIYPYPAHGGLGPVGGGSRGRLNTQTNASTRSYHR